MTKPSIFAAIFLSSLPFLWLFTQGQIMGDFNGTFGNIAGLLGVLLMLWQLILGNRFVARRITVDYISLIKTHIFLGTYGAFFILAHPFLEMLAYGQSWAFLFLPELSTGFGRHVTYGRLAFYLYLLLWLSSAILRDKISYRVWRYLHYIAYPLLALAFLHAPEIGTFLNTFLWLKVYFYLLLAIFAGLVLYRLGQLLNVGKFPYILFDKKTNNAGITSYFFKPLTSTLQPRIGQFFFIKPGVLSESHPFTVRSFKEKTGELIFTVKAVGKFTNQLEQVRVGETVFLDGPYGVFTKEGQNNQPKVIIAGGIGITPFVELISRFGDHNTRLFYANKYLKDAVMRQEFKEQLGANYLDVVSREKIVTEPVIQGRLNEEILTTNLSSEFLSKAKFFVCGSPSFMGGVLMALKKAGVNKNRIFVEEFSL